MGLFKKKEKKQIDFSNIKSVVILEQTQLYTKESNYGKSYGWQPFDTRYYDLPDTVSPCGMKITFSITFKNGTKEICEAKSGTELCNRLLQYAIDPDTEDDEQIEKAFGKSNTTAKETAKNVSKEDKSVAKSSVDPNFQLGKNQLPQGKYEIGKDIPAGRYDFKVVFGDGSLRHHFTDDKAKDGKGYDFFWIGTEKPYENPLVIGRTFNDGDILELYGNVVVEISRSKEIQLDL